MARLDETARARLPDRAFAYVDSKGQRRLPINDEAHVRAALSRFNQVRFEDEASRDEARRRLLAAAKRYGIVPVGFVDGQFRARGHQAAAGRLVAGLGQADDLGELQDRLRAELRDASLLLGSWSEANDGYVGADDRPLTLPAGGEGRAVTFIERRGQPLAVLVHDPATLRDDGLRRSVVAAVRPAVENLRLQAAATAAADRARRLPKGAVTLLMSDIEGSTTLLQALGDRYPAVLAEVRGLHRVAMQRAGGVEVDARADEFFAAFETPLSALDAAVAIQRRLGARSWPDDHTVRVRIGIHHGRPTLTDEGYVGLPIHTTARICAAGHGGQILISRVAHDAYGLAAADPARPPGRHPVVTFEALGRYQLAGLHRPEALFGVVGAGLATGLLPLRAPRIG